MCSRYEAEVPCDVTLVASKYLSTSMRNVFPPERMYYVPAVPKIT